MSAASGALTTMLHSPSDVRVASLFTRAVDTVGVVERHYTIAGLCVHDAFRRRAGARAPGAFIRAPGFGGPRRARVDGQSVGLRLERCRGTAAARRPGGVRRERPGLLLRARWRAGDGPLANALGARRGCGRSVVLDTRSGHDGFVGLGGAPPGDPALVARLARRRAGARRRNRHGGGRGARRRTRRLGEVDDRAVVARRRPSLRGR